MGILGALSTAVSGLSAQSYALENISGNIANASTTGFKRVDTSFENLVADQPVSQQLSGSVSSGSSLTTTVQGTLSSTGIATNMAISGDGFFVVAQNTGTTQEPTFAGGSLYTRRGDFKRDNSGYLTNGAGYYLSGTTYDPSTGAAVGVSPSPIKISSAALAARQTTTVAYSGNLPSLPQPTSYNGKAGSELLPLDSSGTSGAYVVPTADIVVNFTVNGTTKTTTIPTGSTLTQAVALLNTAAGSSAFSEAPTAGAINVASSNQTIVLSPATRTDLAFAAPLTQTTPASYSGAESAAFVNSSISGGQISVYSASGTAANLQLRWAKVDSTTTGGNDKWQLFYQNSSDTSAVTAWTAVGGQTVDFDPNGATSTSSLTLTNVTVGGVAIGSLNLDMSGGLTQYGDSSGQSSVSLDQDGYTSGSLSDVTISDDGSIIGSYSNGQSKKLGAVALAKFAASDSLKTVNGGAYAATIESGNPVLTNNGSSITGGSIEASNTDISAEFSKMIVTQQAYSANTKVMSTAQSMLQDIINIIR